MRSMGTRRAALFAGAASVAAVALGGCSAGQVAETANKNPSIYGVNVENSDGSVLVRSLSVAFPGTKGYPAGGTAPLALALYNETTQPVTVAIGSQPLAGAPESARVVSAQAVGLSGGTPTATPSGSGVPAEAEPSGSRSPAQPNSTESVEATGSASAAAAAEATEVPSVTTTTPAAALQPARITIPALSSIIFQPGDTQKVEVTGLSAPLTPGTSVNLVFQFSNGAAPLVVQAPVAVPASPAPRGSAENEGIGEDNEQGEAEGH